MSLLGSKNIGGMGENRKKFWMKIEFSFMLWCYGRKACGRKTFARELLWFYNYKGDYSVIRLAFVDADCEFMYIDVETNGKANDASAFRISRLN